MAKATFARTSFLGGEWSQRAQGAFNDPRYKTAMATCLNSFPTKEGAWTRRPGTAHCGATRLGGPAKIIDFPFQEANPYSLEFTDGFLRFWTGQNATGVPQRVYTNDTQLVTSISTANPAVVVVANAVNWATGDMISFGALGVNCPLLQNKLFQITFLLAVSLFDAAMAAWVTAAGTGGTTSTTYNATTHQFVGTTTGTAPTPDVTHINAIVTALNTAMAALIAVSGGFFSTVISDFDTANALLVTAMGTGGTTSVTYSATTHQFSSTVSGTAPTPTDTQLNTATASYNVALALFATVARETFSLANSVTGTSIDGSTLGLGSLPGTATVSHLLELTTPYGGGTWASLRSVNAEERSVLLNGALPQVLQVTADPTSTQYAGFSLAAANLLDGPYLDPVQGGALITPSGVAGVITMTISFPAYSSATAYGIGAFVSSSSVNYQSLIDQNQGNTPASSPTAWQAVSAGIAVGPNGFTANDVGRHIRLYSQPADWVTATSYSTGNVVLYTDVDGNKNAWTCLIANTSSAILYPGSDATHWAINPNGLAWTWGKITGLTNLIAANPSGSSNIGNLTASPGGGNAAAFDSNTTKVSTLCAAADNGGAGTVVSGYVGKNFGSGNKQTINLGTWWPSTDQGFLVPSQFTSNVVLTAYLYASQSAPSSGTNGTLLGSKVVPYTNNFSAVTVPSSDQTTAWQYVWMYVVISNPSGWGSHARLNCSQVQLFSPPGSGTSSTTVSVQIIGTFVGVNGNTITQPLLYTTPISIWRLGVYNGAAYPTCGTYIDGRLWLSGSIPNRIDGSTSGGFLTSGNTTSLVSNSIRFSPTNYDGSVTAAHAIDYTFAGPGANPIFWMEPDQQGILCGTLAGEWLVYAPNIVSGFAPTNIAARRVTKIGCANIEPKRTEHTLVFVQKYLREIKEYFADVFSGKFTAPDLSERARHLTQTNLQEITYQQELTPIIWARRGDGKLIGASYKRDTLMTSQGPTYCGWHRHLHGGGRTFTSIRVGPSGSGVLDTLTTVTLDPGTGMYAVEAMTPMFEEGAAFTSAWFVDNGQVPSSYILTSTSLVLQGLWGMNGKTGSAWVNGCDFGDYAVANGAITIPLPVTIVDNKGASLGTVTYAQLNALSAIPAVVGFTYSSQCQLTRAMEPQEAGTRDGPALGKKRRSHFVSFLLENVQQMLAGTLFTRLNQVLTATEGETRTPITQGFSGVWKHTLTDSDGLDSMICWQISRPYPATVAAAQGWLETKDE